MPSGSASRTCFQRSGLWVNRLECLRRLHPLLLLEPFVALLIVANGIMRPRQQLAVREVRGAYFFPRKSSKKISRMPRQGPACRRSPLASFSSLGYRGTTQRETLNPKTTRQCRKTLKPKSQIYHLTSLTYWVITGKEGMSVPCSPLCCL